ncbi:restriction endonuclease subunit S [Ligilactobacillus salivarius]|uniref:restriction endonuclease subunit S n=1 Tax=Ligilactobacillus salivarius TaxID=1624 RepID=UPI0025A3A340|nr:restriction endonuclease subunit S [Ligilactobacillus salivarius]MDM8261941.1 restriction endonuclease subunit S [Ligilactobacillus salivarius]
MFPTQFTSASFTWERKKLGDVANSYINGGTPDTQNKNYWIGDIPWIQSSDLKNDDIWNVNINKYITNKAVNDSAAKLIPANSIAIVTRVGVGKLAYMSQEYSTSQDFLSLVDIKEDLIFIMYMLYFKISKVSSSLQGTSIKGITKKELLNLSISIVNNTAEQNRIGQVFKILDNSINLHERKYEELTLIKKALLQKLFPKKDGFKPEVRYKNFNDAWEQRKLGEVIISEHKGKVKSIMKGGNTNYLETNYLNGGTAQKVDAIADVSKDDVLILWDGSKAGTIYHGFEGALGSTLKAYVPKYSGDFLYQILKKNQDKIYQSYRTPNIPHVIKNFTEKFNVSIPTIIEQQEIGDFFKQLDSLITLHRRKLEKLKQLKKFLLQNMFI